MSIDLQKQNSGGWKGEEELRKQVAIRVFDNYCDRQTEQELLRTGIDKFGMDSQTAKIILEMELEQLGAANERRLLEELEGQLHQFADKDKKLDKKERDDAVQYVCKPRTGYSKGLNYQVADRYITEFCRANTVKVKVGMFNWVIP